MLPLPPEAMPTLRNQGGDVMQPSALPFFFTLFLPRLCEMSQTDGSSALLLSTMSLKCRWDTVICRAPNGNLLVKEPATVLGSSPADAMWRQ